MQFKQQLSCGKITRLKIILQMYKMHSRFTCMENVYAEQFQKQTFVTYDN